MKKLAENLENLTRCPVCDTSRKHLKAVVVKEEENRTIFHITCESCKTANFLFVSVGKIGIAGVGMLTDLKGNEVKTFFGKEAISADNVISIHKFLKSPRVKVRDFV